MLGRAQAEQHLEHSLLTKFRPADPYPLGDGGLEGQPGNPERNGERPTEELRPRVRVEMIVVMAKYHLGVMPGEGSAVEKALEGCRSQVPCEGGTEAVAAPGYARSGA